MNNCFLFQILCLVLKESRLKLCLCNRLICLLKFFNHQTSHVFYVLCKRFEIYHCMFVPTFFLLYILISHLILLMIGLKQFSNHQIFIFYDIQYMTTAIYHYKFILIFYWQYILTFHLIPHIFNSSLTSNLLHCNSIK